MFEIRWNNSKLRKQIFQKQTEVSVNTRLKFSISELYEQRLLELANMKCHAQIKCVEHCLTRESDSVSYSPEPAVTCHKNL